VVAALDAGPILARRERPIGPDETSEEVERALAQLGAALLVESVDDLASGKAVEQPQDDSASTYAPRLSKIDGEIDWSRPARQIHDQVRGLHPWPHAYTFLGEERLIVLRTTWDPPRLAQAGAGTIVEARGDVVSVVAGDGVILQLVEVQPEGRRAMRVREFLSGHPLIPGQRFARSTAR
jgi:methionyl-tRNA formyltransferase